MRRNHPKHPLVFPITWITLAIIKAVKLKLAAAGINTVESAESMPETKKVIRAPYCVHSQLNGNVAIKLVIATLH